jgi:hypothetical protein
MKLRVTLIGTTNTYLQPHLPLTGWLDIIEVGTHGRVIAATFLRDAPASGEYTYTTVVCGDPEFVYGAAVTGPDLPPLPVARPAALSPGEGCES